MVMTILEARVSKEYWATLEKAFQLAVQHKDAGMVQTFLLHSVKDVDIWRILTVWESQEALAAMRSSGETPRGVQMFGEAKAEPSLSIFHVAQHAAW